MTLKSFGFGKKTKKTLGRVCGSLSGVPAAPGGCGMNSFLAQEFVSSD